MLVSSSGSLQECDGERTKSEVGSPPQLLSVHLSVCLWWISVSRVVWWDPKSFPSPSRPPAIFRGPVWFGWSPARMWDLLIKDSKQLVVGWVLVEVQVVRVKCIIVLLSVSSHVISARVCVHLSTPSRQMLPSSYLELKTSCSSLQGTQPVLSFLFALGLCPGSVPSVTLTKEGGLCGAMGSFSLSAPRWRLWGSTSLTYLLV